MLCLGQIKSFVVSQAQTHGQDSVPLFKVECRDHSAIQHPKFAIN